jgi:molybdopterin converting factor small subunit
MMKVNISCFSTLSNPTSCRHDQTTPVVVQDPAATVRSVARQVQVPEDQIALVFVNHRRSTLDQPLSDGDRVAFAPHVGGM